MPEAALFPIDTITGMYVFNGLESFSSDLCGCAASIGKFDGIHTGHGRILGILKSQAEERHIPAVVLTFDPPPIQIFRPDLNVRPICTLQRKLQLLEQLSVNAVVVLPSTKDFFGLDAETFFNKIIAEKIKAKVLVEGMNFNFGNKRSGNADTLRDFGLKHGIVTVFANELRLSNDNVVSSSSIRKMLEDGKIEQANELLYRPFQLCGTVVSGQQRGRTLGFPTANLSGIETVIPKAGVYASSVSIGETNGTKTNKYATTHIGLCPTFGVEELRVEVFIHDFNGDLYGQHLKVNLFSYLRGIIKYNSADELVRSMKNDIAKSREICTSKSALQKELFDDANS